MVARASERQPVFGKTPQEGVLQRGKIKLASKKGVPKLSTLAGLTSAGKSAALRIDDVQREVQGKTAALQQSAAEGQCQLVTTQATLQKKLTKRAKADTDAAEQMLERAEALWKEAQAAAAMGQKELRAEAKPLLQTARSQQALQQCAQSLIEERVHDS